MGQVPNLGRVVFLAPPNRGSPVARVVASFMGRICKTLAEISDREHSFVRELPTECTADVAVLAAKFDALIPIENTHLDGERFHVVLNATHNSLLFSRKAARFAASFLRNG